MQGNLFNKLKGFLGQESKKESEPVPEDTSGDTVAAEQSVLADNVSAQENAEISTNHVAEENSEQKSSHTPEEIKEEVVKVLKTCYDPEIPVDVFELGLIYDIKVATNGDVLIVMTLTSPSCPVAGILPNEIEQKVREHPMVNECKVELTFDPPWNQRMMSEVAMLELGFL
jgi:FeS assembly SUF system protein